MCEIVEQRNKSGQLVCKRLYRWQYLDKTPNTQNKNISTTFRRPIYVCRLGVCVRGSLRYVYTVYSEDVMANVENWVHVCVCVLCSATVSIYQRIAWMCPLSLSWHMVFRICSDVKNYAISNFLTLCQKCSQLRTGNKIVSLFKCPFASCSNLFLGYLYSKAANKTMTKLGTTS